MGPEVFVRIRCAKCAEIVAFCEADYRGQIYCGGGCKSAAGRETKARHQQGRGRTFRPRSAERRLPRPSTCIEDADEDRDGYPFHEVGHGRHVVVARRRVRLRCGGARRRRDRFFAARTISSIEDGNRQLLDFIRDIADARPHPRFRDRTVAEVFAEEQPRLLGLPASLPETDLVAPASVDTTAFVHFATNLYSVPPRYARGTVTLVASDHQVRLLDGATVIARHERSWGKHQCVEDPDHRHELLEQKRAGRIPNMRDRLLSQVAGIDALYTRWVDAGRNVGLMTARTGKLLELYGPELLAKAVADVLARGLHDPGALAFRCEQARRAAGAPMPVALEFGAHVPDCDVTPHDLGQYDRPRTTRGIAR